MSVIRFCRTLHAWGGALLSLLMLLISVSGTLLVWKEDYLRLAIPQARERFEPTPAALAQIATAVEAQFDRNEIVLLEFPTKHFAIARVLLADNALAYVDARGRLIGRWSVNERFEDWLYDLHHRLLSGQAGLLIVGSAAIAMIVLVGAGAVAFWPLRRGFRQGVWPTTLTRPHLLRAHRNLGVIVGLPLLLSLITGVVLSFPAQTERLLLKPFRDESYDATFEANLDGISGQHTGDWLPAIRRAAASFPGAEIRTAQMPNALSEYRIIGLRQPGELNAQGIDKVYIDAQLGHMDVRIDTRAFPLPERLFQASYPLHTARLDSMPYKILLTLSGLLISALSILGLTAFIRRMT